MRRMIREVTGLTGPDGKFDVERYRQLLRAQGKNEVVFEREVRSDLALQTLPEAISQTAIVPASLVDRVIALGEQTREIREIAFRTDDYASKVSPTDAQLAEYSGRSAAACGVPEIARGE